MYYNLACLIAQDLTNELEKKPASKISSPPLGSILEASQNRLLRYFPHRESEVSCI